MLELSHGVVERNVEGCGSVTSNVTTKTPSFRAGNLP